MRGAMGIVAIVFAVLIGFCVIIGGSIWMIYGHYNNLAVTQEIKIKANFKDLQNVKSNYTMKVREMAQVPDMYADKLKEVVGAAIEGRYGKDGSKAVFQMLTEQNPTLDPSMYIRVQQVMEAGRNDFQVAQTSHNMILANYELMLSKFPDSFFFKMVGYPKIDLSKYQIIISGETQHQFETGVDEKINLKDGK